MMDIRVAAAFIKLLGRSDPRVRVILASMASEYDIFLRAQALEGAAGVRPDTWWKRGKKGLKQAEQYFQDRGHDLDPRWFDLNSTDTYNIVVKEIQRGLRKTGLKHEPYEVIHNFLMGLGIIDPDSLRSKRPVFEAGKNQAEGILSGKISPNVAANRDIQGYMVRGLFTEAKGKKRKQEELVEEMPPGYDAPVPEMEIDADAGEFLATIVFWKRGDPLGKKIRDFMRKTWAGTGQEKPMNAWLDVIEQEGRIPTKKEIAEKIGITNQTLTQRHWPKAWRKVINALWANQSLLAQLQKRYEMEGLPWFQKRPDPNELFAPKWRRKAARLDSEMNLKTASAVLRLLKASKDPRARVAMRWIRANMADDYDKMLRAQVLEGAAGVTIGSWWKKGQRGLQQAQEWFADQGFPVRPEWFDKKYSGMYGILEKAIQATARHYGVPLEPTDIMNSSLMGLKADPSEPGHRKEGPYWAGVSLSDKLKAGKETPRSVAGGKLKAYLGRRTSDAAKKKLEQMPEGLEGQELEIADDPGEQQQASIYLADLIFWQLRDPLGQKIRNLMRKSWAGTGRTQDVMDTWLDIIEQQGRIPKRSEVAQILGIPKQDVSSKYWKKGWKLFFDALWRDSRLINELQTRFEVNQIPWFMRKPDWDEVMPKKTRKASDIMVERVTTRWMEGKTDQEITRWFGNPASYPEWNPTV